MTPLDRPLKRQLEIGARPFTLVVDRLGLHLAAKGRRKGLDLRWQDLVSGDAALAHALSASLRELPGERAPTRRAAPKLRRAGRARR